MNNMDIEDKIVVLEKYTNAIDANIVKGALEASGIPAGVIVDSTANAIWMAPVRVVVFERDLELARQVLAESEEIGDDIPRQLTRIEYTKGQFFSLYY